MNQQLNNQQDQSNPQNGSNTIQLKYKLNQSEFFKVNNKDAIQISKKQTNFKNHTLTIDKQDDEVDQIFRDFKEKEDNLKKEIETALINSLSNTRSLKKQRDEASPIIMINRNCFSRNDSRNKERPDSNQGIYSLSKPSSNYTRDNASKNANGIKENANKSTIGYEEDDNEIAQTKGEYIQFIKKKYDDKSNHQVKKRYNLLNKSLEEQFQFQDITDQIKCNNRIFNNKILQQNSHSPPPKLKEIAVDKMKNVSHLNNASNLRKSQVNQYGNKENQRQQSATLQATSSKEPTKNIIQNRSGVRRMESPNLFQNSNLSNNLQVPNKMQQQANFKNKRLQHLADYSSLNNTLTLPDKTNNVKTPNQTSPTQIGLEKRRLKTLNDNSTSIFEDNHQPNRSKVLNTFSQKSSDTPERPQTLQDESIEGFKIFQLHDNLVNYQKMLKPKQSMEKYQTISYQTSSANNKNSKHLNLSQIQESSKKGQDNLEKVNRQRIKTLDSRIEQISSYVKPMLQYQADHSWGNLQPLNINNNNIQLRNFQSHTLEPLTTTEDSESKKQQIQGQYKVKNKSYVNNNFNYKLKILRGTLKRNQLSPENFTQTKLNSEIKENSIIIEENPSQQNLHSQRNTITLTVEEGKRFETQEERQINRQDKYNHSASPQQNPRNKEVLKKFLTKTKQIKSKNFIENLETDNTGADDSCQEQMNTAEDFRTLYPNSNQIYNDKSNQFHQIKKQQIDQNNNRKINSLKPLSNISSGLNQPYYYAQQQLIQEAQSQKLNKKNALRSSDQIDKEVLDEIKSQNVRQIYNKLNALPRNKFENTSQPPSVKNSQSFRKSGSPVSLRDSYGGNLSSITEGNRGVVTTQSQMPPLSREEIEIMKFHEEKKKFDKQRFGPYKIDQMSQFNMAQQNIHPSSSKNSNQQSLSQPSQQQSMTQQNSQIHNNPDNHQRYSFSFQYQQNISSDPSQLQQQILLQTQLPNNYQSPSVLPLRSLQGNKGIKQVPFGSSDVHYGIPIPTNFGMQPMQQYSDENFSPHFSQQLQDQSEFQKMMNKNGIIENQSRRKSTSQQQSVIKENSKQSSRFEDNGQIIKLSQMTDQCPPTPSRITLEYLQKKNESEDSYHTAFYNNQMFVQQVVKDNFYGNSSYFQQKMIAVTQSINQQNTQLSLHDSSLKEVSPNIMNEKLNKNLGIKNQGIEESSRLIILQKTNNQLKAETFIDQAKFSSEEPNNTIRSPNKRVDEPTKSIIM